MVSLHGMDLIHRLHGRTLSDVAAFVWFHESSGDDEQEVAHPESFLTDVGKLQGFLEQHCHSPSLFQLYEDTCRHNDDQEFVLFIAGRLKVASETLMVAAVHLNC